MTIPDRDIVMTDGNIILRPVQADDLAAICQAVEESAPTLAPWMPWYHIGYSLRDTQTWFDAMPRSWEEGLGFDFAVIDAAQTSFLGMCGINQINSENRFANLGYWVRTSRAGQGVATAAAVLTARFGFEALALNRLEIVAARHNFASQRVAEKVGAQWEGVLRNRLVVRENIYDAVMFSLLPEDLDD